MLIAVNTRLLIPGKLNGIGWFTYETLKRITTGHPEHEFLFLFDRPVPEEFVFSSNIEPLYLFPPARHPFLWYWWFEYSVRKILEAKKPDLFLSPDGYLCLSTNTVSVPVIHDINFFHRKEDIPFLARHYYLRQFPKFARKACRIATVSEYTKEDIRTSYGIDPEIIDVVYNGANSMYVPLNEETRRKTKESFSEGEDFFLFVGSLHPRKNLANLLLAFDGYRKASSRKMKLVIVGEQLFKTGKTFRVYREMSHRKDVIFTGRQPVEKLQYIMGSAFALVLVSFYEGFGIP
ncbi:MAG: glycosyltransferase family 4 protein, partial [Bacteroidales bacterium]